MTKLDLQKAEDRGWKDGKRNENSTRYIYIYTYSPQPVHFPTEARQHLPRSILRPPGLPTLCNQSSPLFILISLELPGLAGGGVLVLDRS
jgi:hypothetical protein